MRPNLLVSALGPISIWPVSTSAAGLLRDGPCFEACQMSLRGVKFTDLAGMSPYPKVRTCHSRLAVSSLYLCTAVYCTIEERNAGLKFQNESCRRSAKIPLPPFSIIANYTDKDISQLRRFQQNEAEFATPFGEAVVPSDRFFGLAFDTLDSWSYASRNHMLYGSAVFVFWIFVVAIGLLNRIVQGLCHSKARSLRQVPTEEPHREIISNGTKRTISNRFSIWVKRNVTLPAAFGYRNAQPFGWYTVPPRIQSLTILAFILLNVAFCAHGYHVFPGNLYFPKTFTQTWRYISDRTGIISLANFPVIWLFGMRNNFLLWLTGWDFGTYNNFHRWVARVSTVQAIIHSVGYTVLIVDRGGWTSFLQYLETRYFWAGQLATIFMCLLLALSLYWMRRNVYEAFLALHIVLSILILSTMWGHVSVFKVPWDRIVWVCVVIWALDRGMRMLRTVSFNPMFWNTRARASYDPDANMVRLEIPCSRSFYQPRPGTFYYLHLLNDLRFWESHPFTMASFQSRSIADAVVRVQRPSSDQIEEAALLLPSGGVDTAFIFEQEHTYSQKPNPAMTFLIRPYDSFTRRLRDAAASAWPQPASLRVLVEGPYGHTQPFHRFDKIVFIVGGSGIVVPLAHVESLCKRKSPVKSVRIVWAVREATFAASVLKDDLRNAFDCGKLSMDIYVTKTHGCRQLAESSKEARVLHGRPDVHAEVEDVIRDTGKEGSVAVVASGPARMADDARKAVADLLSRERCRIEYFEESFNW